MASRHRLVRHTATGRKWKARMHGRTERKDHNRQSGISIFPGLLCVLEPGIEWPNHPPGEPHPRNGWWKWAAKDSGGPVSAVTMLSSSDVVENRVSAIGHAAIHDPSGPELDQITRIVARCRPCGCGNKWSVGIPRQVRLGQPPKRQVHPRQQTKRQVGLRRPS